MGKDYISRINEGLYTREERGQEMEEGNREPSREKKDKRE